ncbi:hypothetical protein M5689_012738 [Euphorbia peplus]|nr:hypothetical protein M5689_012738 [Euphorbia peplus]
MVCCNCGGRVTGGRGHQRMERKSFLKAQTYVDVESDYRSVGGKKMVETETLKVRRQMRKLYQKQECIQRTQQRRK